MKFLTDILARAGLVVEGVVSLNSVANATIDTDKFLTVDSGVVKYRTGAQLLSDIGGQSLLTNPVTGTGTAGQVAFYTGTTAISGDSGLFWDNTNKRLGISATTPYTNVQIGSGSGAKYLGIVDTADATYNIGYIGHNGDKLHIGFSNSNTSISERNAISIDSALLYVGIGVNAPANKLQVGSVGSTGFSGNTFAFGNGTAATAFFQANTYTVMYLSTYLSILPSGSGTGNLVVGGLTNSGYRLDVQGTFRVTSTVTFDSIAAATTDTDRFLVSDSGVIKYRTGTQLLSDIGGISGNQTITVSGDATGSGTTSIALTLANSGVTAGTYRSVTVDVKGIVTAGTNPTTISGYGITDFYSQVISAFAVGANSTVTTADTLETAIEKLQGQVNARQATLNGTGFVRMSGTTVSYLTGTSAQFVKADGSLDSSSYFANGDYYAPNAVFGQRPLRSQIVDNVLYQADSRFNATRTDTSARLGNGLFNGVYDNTGLSIAAGTSVTYNINFTANGNSSITYTEGYIYLHFYHNWTPASVSGRVKDNGGTWRSVTGWVNVSTSGSNAVWRGTVPTFNYMTDMEITITAQAGANCGFSQWEYVMNRPGQYEWGVISKLQNNNLWTNLNFRNGSNASTISFVASTGVITAASFVRSGGTSSQFLKADGSVDSNTYLTSLTDTLATVTARGASTSTQVTFSGAGDNSTTYSSVRFSGYNQGGGVGYHGFFEVQNTYGSVTNGKKFFRIDGAGTLQIINSAYTTNIFNLTDAGALTVQSIIKSGGTSSQFLKADGSVDSSVYITGNQSISLTGEATGSGTTSIAVTLTNSAVIGKVLTGLNITGGTVAAADTILTAFGKLQNQVNGLTGGVTYQGTWNASTNTPTLASSTGTKGFYYVVSVAGSTALNGVSSWSLGDWVIYNGSAWEKVDNTDAVISVNGFTGAVSLTTANVSESGNLYYTDARARAAISLTTTGSSGAATYNSGTGVLNVPTYTLAGLGGQAALSGTGFVKISGTTVSYDNSTYALSSHTHSYFIGTTAVQTSSANQGLTGISSIGFVAEGSDSASISTTISGTSTFFDFNLTDDNNNDEWRWRFTPSGATVYNAMRLVPVSNTAANLIVSGTITGSQIIRSGGTASQFLKADGSVDSSTYLTSSSLSSYVPYTGATTSLNLGVNNITAQNYISDGNGSTTGGYFALKQYSSSNSGAPGYTSLYAVTQNSLYIRYSQTDGSQKNVELSSALLGTTTRQYVFPNASGTFALTSDIPTVAGVYLPLSGGTLTGALGGTSATFTGTIVGGGNLELTNAGGSYVLVGEGTGANQYAAIDWDATNNRLRIATQPFAFGANGGQITLTTGGDVGIGTTAPLYRLEVQNATGDDHIAAIGTAPSIQFASANSGPANWGTIGMATTSNNFLIGAVAGDFAIINRGTTAGNILLGFGSTERARLTNAGQLRLTTYTSSSAWTGTAVATLGVDSSGNVITVTGGGGSSQWVTSGSNIYYNTGSVGIGTTAPVLHSSTTGLVVRGSGRGIIELWDATSGKSVFQNVGGDTYIGQLDKGTGAGRLYLLVNGNGSSADVAMTMLANGSVGIGTTSPSDKLEVRGADDGITISSIVANRPVLKFVNGSTTMLKLSANGLYGAIADNTGNDTVFFKDGRVGIGTTSPVANLHIASNTNTGIRINATASNGSAELDLLSNGTQSAFIDYGPNQLRFRSTNADMSVINNGSVLVLDNGGYVGLGTTSPGYKLHVLTSDNEGIYLQGTGGGIWMNIKSAAGKMWSYGAQNDGCGIYNRTDGVYRLFIADSGVVTLSNTVVSSDGYQGRYYRINEASANRGGLYPYNLVVGSGTDYSIGIFSEGEIFFASGGSATKRFTMNSSGAATFSSSITCTSLTETSTMKVKENIVSIDSALDQVEKLQAVSYNRKGSSVKEIGLIAEAVEEVYPEFVQYDQNGEPIGLNYSRLTAVLIESVKELKKEIDLLKENRN